MALASSDPAPLQASRSRRRSRRKGCKEKVKGAVTEANATGIVYNGLTSIMCTDITEDQFPSKTKTDDYFFMKINGNYKKVLYTDVASNWGGDYIRGPNEGLIRISTPDNNEVTIDIVPPNLADPVYPATGTIDGNKIHVTFKNAAISEATNVNGLITFTVTQGTYSKIGTETPDPDNLSTGQYYAFFSASDGTGTCPADTLAIGVQDGEASSENNLDVENGDTLKLYFKSKNCGGKRCGSSGHGRHSRSRRGGRHHSDVEEVDDIEELEDVNGEDEFAQFWADKEVDINDDWEEEEGGK